MPLSHVAASRTTLLAIHKADDGGKMSASATTSVHDKDGTRMARIGDHVTVEIRGTDRSGTILSGTLTVGPGKTMQVSGKIVEEHGDYWLVELAISVGGKNRILVHKAAQKQ
jgi:hypothetical protein